LQPPSTFFKSKKLTANFKRLIRLIAVQTIGFRAVFDVENRVSVKVHCISFFI